MVRNRARLIWNPNLEPQCCTGLTLLAGALLWVAAILLGWLLNRRTTRREGSAPDPFNWRLLVNPGLYYEWVRRQ